DYGGQIADALAAAHRAGLIHRDLKPGNIMITPEGRVKVVDFGLAKLAAGTDSSEDPAATRKALTARGAVIGTVAYMSPEQAEGKPLDARTDIFSYGAVLYEMLTGRRAFAGDSGASTMASVLKEDPLPLNVSRDVNLLVTTCLRKDPNKRLQNIGDAKLLLELWGGPQGLPTAATSRPKPVPAVLAAIFLTALATATGTYLLTTRIKSTPATPIPTLSRLTSGVPALTPAVSPDGNLVVYARFTGQKALSSADAGVTTQLWLQPTRGGAEVRLAEGAYPQFHADNSKVYFSVTRDPAGIYEVPITGGEPRLVIPSASRVFPSPDGRWLAYTLDGKVMLRPVDGGEARPLSPTAGHMVVWSPDGRRTMIFGTVPGAAPPFDFKLVPIDGGEPQNTGLFANLIARKLAVSGVTELTAWLPGDDIVLCIPMGAAYNLARLPLSRLRDGNPTPLMTGVGANCQASFGREKLVFANRQSWSGIWRLPVDWASGRVTGPPVRITQQGVPASYPDVRPDGSALTFVGLNSAAAAVFLTDLRRGATRLLASPALSAAYSTFSPDGSRVAFGTGGADWPAYIVSAAGGPVERAGNALGRVRGWSPDGRFLLIWRGSFAQRKSAIGIVDVNTHESKEVLASAKYEIGGPRLSADGQWVLFSAAENGDARPDLYAAPFRGAQTVAESEWQLIARDASNPVWSPDQKSLLFINVVDGVSRLMRIPLVAPHKPASAATEMYRFEGQLLQGLLQNTLSASRDGLYVTMVDGPSDIWMMDLPQREAK
ncbi:MAG: serine/threonine-protein kinase, partial [Bryobacterales bacterium]|nr:serine/threonine-protein kinase [Bryobacterales bacterium]